MLWNSYLGGFKAFLQLEKSLSPNSVEAYLADLSKLIAYLQLIAPQLSPKEVNDEILNRFVIWCADLGMSARTQARVLSGIRAFFRYLLIEDIIEVNPANDLQLPKLARHLPEVLSVDEIDRIIAAIDLSKPEGERNKAIIEMLYSCGLRVSELVNAQISNIYWDSGFIRIIGKGSKERLVPIGAHALKQLKQYISFSRSHISVKSGNEDVLFLNRRGAKLTRIMVFTIVKELSQIAGIQKNISPHTFRHSFASHLIDGGADLRAIQEMLGHESITTTEIYTHLNRDYLRDTIIHFHPRELDGKNY